MNTLYTATGRYENRSTGAGRRYPVVINGNKEFLPDIHEMLIWTCLNWSILSFTEIEEKYIRKCSEHDIVPESGKLLIEGLHKKGIVMSGSGDTLADALYDLLGEAYITIPSSHSLFIKALSYLKLTLINGVPFRKAFSLFHREKYYGDEKRVMDLAKQTALSTAEIIKCVEYDAYDVSSDDKLLDVLYSDETTTSDNISIVAKLYGAQKKVVVTISNLYLRKQIILQRI